MKFKDLNSIGSGIYQKQIAAMTLDELESEVLKLFKEEKKDTKDKAALYKKAYQAIEVIDQIKEDFVAEGTKELRQLYFKSLSYSTPPSEDSTSHSEYQVAKPSTFLKINLYHQTKQSAPKTHYSKLHFQSINDIKEFLQNILNEDIVTVIEGKYLQVYSKQKYKISWLEDEINKQIKLLLKEKPVDLDKVLSAAETLLFLDKIVPAFLSRAEKTTRNNLEKCIGIIHNTPQTLEEIIIKYNIVAKAINKELFNSYGNIDSQFYKSNAQNWYVTTATDWFSRPVVEITTDSTLLFELLHFNKILKLGLENAQLKGQAFLPVLLSPPTPEHIADVEEAFIHQTININFEIKLRRLAKRHNELLNVEKNNKTHRGIADSQDESKLESISEEKEQIEMELNALRSIPVSETCFCSMLQHRNSLAMQLSYQLTDEQQNGLDFVYFNKQSLGNHKIAYSYLIPKIIHFLQHHIDSVNYCIEYTQKKYALHQGSKTHLSLAQITTDMKTAIESYKKLEEQFEEHRNQDNLIWAGERSMRSLSLIRVIQFAQLLNIDINLQDIDENAVINIDMALERVLEYPGFDALQKDIELSDIDAQALEQAMSFWPQTWQVQYQDDLDNRTMLSIEAK